LWVSFGIQLDVSELKIPKLNYEFLRATILEREWVAAIRSLNRKKYRAPGGSKVDSMSMVHTKVLSRFLFLLAALVFSAGAFLAQSMDYAIEHVTVINPGGGKPQPDRTIVVSGHTITTIVLSKDFRPTASVRLIDAAASLSSLGCGICICISATRAVT
jgi:hypothetical protein